MFKISQSKRKVVGAMGSALFLCGTLLAPATPANADDRQIGGYVAQAEPRFQRNVWNFIKNFKSPQSVGAHKWKYDQYYWAEPYVFLGNKSSYVDSQDLAFFSGHGANFRMACHNKTADVDFRDATGYGDLAKGGDLEFIIFESCSVVPSAPELTDWYSPWLRDAGGKHIFQGLHQALGYRTLSWSDNGIPNDFGKRLRGSQAMWPAWFAAVNSERVWDGDDLPYPGFASVVLYPGLDNDSLGSYGNDPPANHNSLRTYWQY